ncbi:DUF4862 family protein [Marinomonas agarivorans]|nr:DUF4862 family protein [Marinomonas agarivorans]
MSYFIGAYASSPNVAGWDADLESEYYKKLTQLPNLRGLEHPFMGTLHPHDDAWFLANVAPDWDIIFTCIPGIMNNLASNPHFGLASENEAGRQEAIAFMQQAREAIVKLNDYAGRQVVPAIEIQTAPNTVQSNSSTHALKVSLETMLTWDWDGAQIVIEHCDQVVSGQNAAKGFLSLADEIKVLLELKTKYPTAQLGIVINWGRSVLEGRHVDRAVQHITELKKVGLLSGVMFSGVSDIDSEYGAWADTHMPPAPATPKMHGEAHSLLTKTEIERCLLAAGGVGSEPEILGVKLGVRPFDTSLNDRLAYNRDALSMLSDFYTATTIRN